MTTGRINQVGIVVKVLTCPLASSGCRRFTDSLLRFCNDNNKSRQSVGQSVSERIALKTSQSLTTT